MAGTITLFTFLIILPLNLASILSGAPPSSSVRIDAAYAMAIPPVSRFGGTGRAKKKQSVVDKLKAFFVKYFGLGGSSMFEEVVYESSGVYDVDKEAELERVAEKKIVYDENSMDE